MFKPFTGTAVLQPPSASCSVALHLPSLGANSCHLLVLSGNPASSSMIFSLRVKPPSPHSSVLFDLLSVEREREKSLIKLYIRKTNLKILLKKCMMELSSYVPVRVCTLSRPPPVGPFHSLNSPTQPLWAFDLGTPAFDFKALRPEEDALFLLTSIVVSYSSSQL